MFFFTGKTPQPSHSALQSLVSKSPLSLAVFLLACPSFFFCKLVKCDKVRALHTCVVCVWSCLLEGGAQLPTGSDSLQIKYYKPCKKKARLLLLPFFFKLLDFTMYVLHKFRPKGNQDNVEKIVHKSSECIDQFESSHNLFNWEFKSWRFQKNSLCFDQVIPLSALFEQKSANTRDTSQALSEEADI